MAKLHLLICFLFMVGCNQESAIEISTYDESVDYFEDTEGNRIPKDRHIGWPIEAIGIVEGKEFPVDESSRIAARLKSESIDVEFVTFYGNNHMVWEEKDDDCVRKIIDNQWCEKESNK